MLIKYYYRIIIKYVKSSSNLLKNGIKVMDSANDMTNRVDIAQTPLDERQKGFLVSLIAPVYNEEESVQTFTTTIASLLSNINWSYEIIFINDGSSDNTKDIITKISQDSENITVINFARNFGKEAAMTAGINFAKGNAVIPIDVDLQDPPEVILQLVEKWQEGYDVVNGVRVDRQKDTLGKRSTALGFYKVFNMLASIKIPENVGDFRLFDRCAVEAIKLLPERARFMKGLFAWVGFDSAEVTYERQQRELGLSKFNYWKLWNFALEGIVNFSTLPLKIWSYFGLLTALLSLIYISILVIKTFVFGIDVPGYASTVSLIIFFGALQLISIGVIGEYLSRIVVETKKRPLYIISSISK